MAIFASSSAELPNPVPLLAVPEVVPPSPGGSTLPLNITPPDRDVATDRGGFLHRGMRSVNKVPQRAECFLQHGDRFWFEHFHLIPSSLALGTVLSTQERTYELFNAYRFDSFVLSDIVKDSVDGIEFDGEPTSSPRLIKNKTGFLVTVTVSPTGPVSINATVTYTIATAPPIEKLLTITGTRVVILSTEPDGGVSERWEYVTDIFTASAGHEYRQSVRDIPRQSFRYSFLREDRDLQRLLNQLWGWHENTWGLPIWTDYTTLSDDIVAGATTLPVVSTEKRDFRDGNELAIVWSDAGTFEAVEVTAISANALTLAQGTLSAFSAGDVVAPLRLAKARADWSATNYRTAARDVSIVMQVLDNVDFDDALSPAPVFDGGTYRGLPVWDIDEDYLVIPGTYSESEGKDLRIFGDRLGKFSSMSTRDFPRNQLSGLSMEAFGRDEFWRLRAFLHYLRGRQKAIWVPTGREDFTVESETTTPTTEINVEPCDYTTLVYEALDGPKTRRNIEILYADGTRDRRRIVDAQATAGVREVLTVDSVLSQDCNPANVQRISFLVKRRLASDRVVFEHEFYEGEVSVPGLGLVDVFDGE